LNSAHHYKQYSGYIIYQREWGVNLFKADGRVMVDISTFQRINPEYTAFKDPKSINNNLNNGDDLAWMNYQYGG
jgi:hypothetical protein